MAKARQYTTHKNYELFFINFPLNFPFFFCHFLLQTFLMEKMKDAEAMVNNRRIKRRIHSNERQVFPSNFPAILDLLNTKSMKSESEINKFNNQILLDGIFIFICGLSFHLKKMKEKILKFMIIKYLKRSFIIKRLTIGKKK